MSVCPDAPEGSLPKSTGIFTLVLTLNDDVWKLAAATNVQDATPPAPPPT